MFGIGIAEFLLILILLVLVVGPEQLPDVVRKGVGFLREARRYLAEIKEALDEQSSSLRQPLQDIRDEVLQNKGAVAGGDEKNQDKNHS